MKSIDVLCPYVRDCRIARDKSRKLDELTIDLMPVRIFLDEGRASCWYDSNKGCSVPNDYLKNPEALEMAKRFKEMIPKPDHLK